MITKWKVSNFKSIRKETELSMVPLTIFAGANSSGKSTLIQSILLMAQTLSHKIGSRSVILNGSLVALGQFNDIKSSGNDSEEITISCTCKPIKDEEHTPDFFLSRQNAFDQISCEISFDGGGEKESSNQIQPRLSRTSLRCFPTQDFREKDRDNSFFLRVEKIKNSSEQEPISSFAKDYYCDIEYDDFFGSEIQSRYKSAKVIGCSFNHFLPNRISFEISPAEKAVEEVFERIWMEAHNIIHTNKEAGLHYDTKEYEYEKNLEENLPEEIYYYLRSRFDTFVDSDNGKYKDFFKVVDKILIRNMSLVTIPGESKNAEDIYEALKKRLYQVIYELIQENSKSGEKPQVRFQPSDQIVASSDYLSNFFGFYFKYIGPLRDGPKSVYPLTAYSLDTDDIGLKGEGAASVLELQKELFISYIPPEEFKNSGIPKKKNKVKLWDAVIDWLKYLNLANSIEIEDKGKLGHEVKVRLPEASTSYDLTHVGVGFSQVFPIVVMGLLAKEGSTLIFEQPELHLHPAVQSLLGDFFLSLALAKKQCIVETHSEYLIDKLRLNVAEAQGEEKEKLANDITIYFVEYSNQMSEFCKLEINKNGGIDNWPKGFFDESVRQSEKILKASMGKN